MLRRDEAKALLWEHGRGENWTLHCFAVAEAAECMGSVVAGRHDVDLDALWPMALLHDIGRCVTHDPVLHGVEGYRLLIAAGHEDAAFVCASHILFGLDAGDAARVGLPTQDFVPRTLQQRIITLADLLVDGEQPTTLERRFASLAERNAGNAFFSERLGDARHRAESFLKLLDREAGCSIAGAVASALGRS